MQPDHLKLTTTEFKTPSQRAAVRELLLLWPRTHNIDEIARRTGWSAAFLRDVKREYLEGTGDESDATSPFEADVVEEEELQRLANTEAYRAGYRDGYRDGMKDAEETSTGD